MKICKEYGISKIVGDAYSGNTHRAEFEAENITYELSPLNKSNLYHELEVAINNEEVELLDHELTEFQLYTLVANRSPGKVDHQPGDHDDHANALAGAVYLCRDDTDEVTDLSGMAGLEKPNIWGAHDHLEDLPMGDRSNHGFRW